MILHSLLTFIYFSLFVLELVCMKESPVQYQVSSCLGQLYKQRRDTSQLWEFYSYIYLLQPIMASPCLVYQGKLLITYYLTMQNDDRNGCEAVFPVLVFPALTDGAVWWSVMLVGVELKCCLWCCSPQDSAVCSPVPTASTDHTNSNFLLTLATSSWFYTLQRVY